MLVSGVSLIDVFVSFFYIALIILVAFFFRPNKKLETTKYYFPFIISKIIAVIAFVLIHSYYYKGGDTFLYFTGAKFMVSQLSRNLSETWTILSSSWEGLRNIIYTDDIVIINYFKATDVFFMSKLVSLFCFLGFKQFLATSILLTLFSSIGIWKLYITLCKLYPSLHKHFAFGVLFYPTIAIWGSGILKDTLILACVGFLFNSTYNIMNRKKIILSIILIISCIYISLVLKPYILYTFIPSILLWAQGLMSKKVENKFIKALIAPIILGIFVGGGYFFLNSVSDNAGKYSLQNVQSVAEGFQSWHAYLSETRDQSGYSLGEFEFTPSGILRKSPEAFFVTYYRPFLFADVRNVATLFEGIQTFILLLLSIYILVKVGIISFFKIIFTDPNVRFFLLFSVFFGVAIGLTSYNFGALSRYKIPSLPFFTAALAVIYYKGYLLKKQFN